MRQVKVWCTRRRGKQLSAEHIKRSSGAETLTVRKKVADPMLPVPCRWGFPGFVTNTHSFKNSRIRRRRRRKNTLGTVCYLHGNYTCSRHLLLSILDYNKLVGYYFIHGLDHTDYSSLYTNYCCYFLHYSHRIQHNSQFVVDATSPRFLTSKTPQVKTYIEKNIQYQSMQNVILVEQVDMKYKLLVYTE